MAPIVGKDYTLNKIMPILTELIKDENAEVRLNVTQNLSKVSQVAQTDLLVPSFLTILTNMTKDPQWRVRMAVIQLVGDLALQYGRDVFQKNNLEPIFLAYLTNSAAAVREIGIKKVKEIAAEFKQEWVMTNFIPKITETYNVDK